MNILARSIDSGFRPRSQTFLEPGQSHGATGNRELGPTYIACLAVRPTFASVKAFTDRAWNLEDLMFEPKVEIGAWSSVLWKWPAAPDETG